MKKKEIIAAEGGVAEVLAMRSRFTKQLAITAVVAVVACVSLFGVGTWAWFASNKTVTSEGLNMQIDSDVPSLIINESAEAIKLVKAATVNDLKVDFGNTLNTTKCKPATYKAGAGTKNLVYVKDASLAKINVATGLGAEAGDMVDVTGNEEGVNYFYEYTVYIASLNVLLENIQLRATFAPSNTLGDADTWMNATAIDFYVGDSTECAGTVHLESGDNTAVLDGVNSIPLNSSDPLKVTLRCYFDGAKTINNNGTTAYIRTSDIPSTKTVSGLKVTFTAEDKPSGP